MNKPTTGYLSEIFLSCQGEGPWIGFRQVFIRLGGCSYRCAYCDTLSAQEHPKTWKWRGIPGSARPRLIANPIAVPALLQKLQAGLPGLGPIHSFVLTGGEPCEQTAFLSELALGLRKNFPETKLLLETNGIDCSFQKTNKTIFDYISMDIKLQSTAGKITPWKQHTEFLTRIPNRFGSVKLVCSLQTTTGEVRKAARMAFLIKPEWDLVLQPMKAVAWKKPGNWTHLDRLLQTAMQEQPMSRVIPQMHKLLGIA